MSIEKQLSEVFKHNEASLQCPPSLDNRIMAEYEQAAMDKGRNVKMMKKGRLPKVALIAIIVVLLCGFAYGSKFLFSNATDKLSYQLYSSDAFHLKEETFQNVRATINEVQSQLAPGEAALVYLPEVIKDFPLYGVYNPEYIADKQQWQQVLEEQGVTEQLPDSLLGDEYQFEAGAVMNYPLIGLDQDDLIAELEAERKSSNNEKPIWRLTDRMMDSYSKFTSVYRAAHGNAIQLSWQIYDEVTKIDGYTSPTTDVEELNLNGKKAHYTKNNQSLLAESGVLQSVMWLAEKDGKSIMYTIESDSPDISKETLIEAAKSLP
ncbi:DUF4367 domain-containing protein [Paenibacillus sp. FSL W7-1287]|uniref:DUF4367 domain-containing protein n=1 Tax=Paenibacillus sp. FSL W7-1287 TaxID=2954538 RepID=UPI0030FB9FC8